jgi:autotransporter-associated beta strand protein
MEFWAGRFKDGKLGGLSRGRRGGTRRGRRSLGLKLEPLESRLVLSTSTWTGANSATNVNWSNAVNWQGDVAPVAGNDLVFPTGVTGAALTTNNDTTANTSYNSLTIQNSGYTLNGNAVDLATTIDSSQTSGSSTLGLPVAFGTNPAAVTVDNAAATLVISGVVSGSDGLTKNGEGVLDLTADNTYTGTTVISDGALHVDGTVGAVTADLDTTLAGTGTVGSITTTAATVSPGDANLGVLTDTGALTLDSNSFFDSTINGTTAGTNYTQLQVAGAINLANATLNVTLSPSFTPATGQQFTIINNTGTGAITGTFAGLPEGAKVTVSGQQFTISYQGGTNSNSVVLTAVAVSTATWTGGDTGSPNNNDKWSDTGNWQGGIVPTTGYDVIFPTGLTTAEQTSNNDLTGLQLTSILVKDTGYAIGGNAVTLSGGIDASQTSSSSTVSLPVTFTNAGTVTVDNTAATLVLGGAITGSDGLTKEGSGVLDLTADSGSLGTTVDGGTLLVDNTSGSGGTIGNVGVNPGTTLGGTGTVAAITTAGATVSPGDSSTSTGILTATGTAVFDANSTFVETINGATAGTNYSQLQAGGTINLANATLSTTLGASFKPTAGEQFTIINNTGTSAITGTFAGLAQGAILTISGQQFSISYKGGTNSNSVVLTTLTPTTTTVSPVTTSPVFGQSVTLTATVAPTTGTGTPTGTVQFVNGTTDLGSPVTLNSSGVATLATTKLTTGSNSITAVYSGDSTYSTSTSAAVPVTVAQASSTTTVTTSPNPSLAGQNVTLTATIAAVSPGSGTPTGTVNFESGTTSLGDENVIDGVATLNTTSLPTGTSSITAVYSGDSNFTASTSTAVNQVVTEGATTVALSASNTNPFGLQPVTLTAIVSVVTGSGTPTGTVTFYDSEGDNLGSSTLSNNQATLTVSTIPVGSQSIIAVYSGDSSFLGATSAPLAMVIGHATQLFVNQVYLDALGVPSGYSAAYWNALINGGFSPKRVSTYILQTSQAKVYAVETAYEGLLGRSATSAELNRALATGTERSPKLYAKIFGSQEFYQTQGGGTIDGFLNALALHWFGTPFKPATQARLARELRHGASRYQVSLGVITSPSGVRAEVNSIFEAVLDRPATAKEQTHYAPQVSKGNIVPLYATLFASMEFKAKFVSL